MNLANYDVIYFDLDGVLADWVAAFEELFNIAIEDFNALSEEERDALKMNLSYDFYRNLNVIPRGLNLFNETVNEVGIDRVAILSAYGDFNCEEVMSAKTAWVREFLGYDINVYLVPSLEDKARYATPTSVLVDDRIRGINAFVNAGGAGYHFV